MRQVVEENTALLLRRWQLVRDARQVQAEVGLDHETTAVLQLMTEDEVERAAECPCPLFGLALDERALQHLASLPVTTLWPALGGACPLTDENRCFLIARWRIALGGSLLEQSLHGLDAHVVTWLADATLADLEAVAQAGMPCMRLLVRPAYLWQAGKVEQMLPSQRANLAVAGGGRFQLAGGRA